MTEGAGMIRHLTTPLALVLGATSILFAGQQESSKGFEHYEAIRAALSADTLKGMAEHAAALAPLAAEAGGADAKQATDLLAVAGDLKAARQQFGLLSAALLPTFEKAALADVYFYTCSMVNKSWAQRGKPVQNPYMGKAMLTCGVPAKPSK